MRLRLDLGYDGTDFSGWASQPGQRTVEGVLAAALRQVTGEDLRLTVAGRTDAGVHAVHQVVHVDLPDPGEASRLLRALNGVLPEDVRVTGAGAAPPGFDARFSALERSYVYRIADTAAALNPVRRWDTTPWRRRLDEDEMALAGERLLGEHDFRAFCRPREGATTIRELRRLRVTRTPEQVLEVGVTADAFCHHMVRALVGSLIAVGEGRRPVSWPGDVLDRGVRDSAVLVAPARGLTLVAVSYPPDSELAARATASRRRRTL